MNKGILYMLLAGICFLVVNFFVKILGSGEVGLFGVSGSKFPAHELVFFRSLISFSISFYLLKKRKLPVLGNNKKWLIVRGLSGMIALTLFFYTIHFLPLAIASTIQYLAPIFTIILAVLIVNERLFPIQIGFILLAFVGAALIGLNNFLVTDHKLLLPWEWILIGIVSSFFSGIAYVSILKLKHSDSPLNIVIYFPMLSLPIMGIWCLFDFVIPIGIEWFYILVIGIFTQIAQISLTRALHLGDTTTVTPFQYLGSIYALIVGYLIFDEVISFYAFIGICLILFGVIMNIFFRSWKEKKLKAEKMF